MANLDEREEEEEEDDEETLVGDDQENERYISFLDQSYEDDDGSRRSIRLELGGLQINISHCPITLLTQPQRRGHSWSFFSQDPVALIFDNTFNPHL